MSTGQSSCYDGYGSYDGPKKISSNKTPQGSQKMINKKYASVENWGTKKMSTGQSSYYDRYGSYDCP